MVCFIKLKVMFDIEEIYWRKLKEILKDINKILKDRIMNKPIHKIQTLISLIISVIFKYMKNFIYKSNTKFVIFKTFF